MAVEHGDQNNDQQRGVSAVAGQDDDDDDDDVDVYDDDVDGSFDSDAYGKPYRGSKYIFYM